MVAVCIASNFRRRGDQVGQVRPKERAGRLTFIGSALNYRAETVAIRRYFSRRIAVSALEIGMIGNVTVTERAAHRIGEILKGEPNGTMLRVSVEGGGCSGFQYRFDTEHTRAEDDMVIEKGGATVLIDPVSLDYMAGSEIDF